MYSTSVFPQRMDGPTTFLMCRGHVCPEEETEYLDSNFSLIEPVATEHQRHLLVSEVLLRIKSKFTKLWLTENISYWYLTWLYRFFVDFHKLHMCW